MKKLLSLSLLLLAGAAAQAQWVQQNTGFPTLSRGIRDISIVDPQTAWAVTYDGGGTSANTQDFTRTTNGGTTWTNGAVTGPGIANFTNANISAINGTTAWIAMYGTTSAAGGRIYKTTDGGQTWVRQNLTGYTTSGTSFLNFVHFFNANDGVAQGDPVGGTHEIYTTNDGGASWTRVPAANIPAATSGAEYGLVNLYSTVGNTIWFGTVTGRVFKSTNKGLNWTVVQTPFTGASGNEAMDDIEFTDENNGLIKDAELLARTTDGGATWTAITTTGLVNRGDISAVPGTTGTYVSVGPSIAAPASVADYGSSYTTDGGLTWTTIDTGVQYNHSEFFSPTAGWAGGFSQASGVGGIYDWTGNLSQLANDIGISAITSPNSGCGLGAAQVCVTITNFGTADQTNFPVSMTLNSGTPVVENFTGTLAAGASANYCFTATANLATAGTYNISVGTTLTGDGNSANNLAQTTVTSGSAPTVTVSNATPSVCSGQSVVITASGASSYVWSPATGINNTAAGVVTANPTATTTYTVTGSTLPGCTGTANVTVTVNQAPSAAFTVAPAAGTYTFTPSTPATGGTYNWTFPGGTPATSTQQTPAVTYAASGTYSATLAVIANGCTTTTTQTFTVLSADLDNLSAQAHIYPNPTSGMLNVDMPASMLQNATVSVFNNLGQEVKVVRTDAAATVQLNLSGLAAGTYTLRVQTEDAVLMKKVILQN